MKEEHWIRTRGDMHGKWEALRIGEPNRFNHTPFMHFVGKGLGGEKVVYHDSRGQAVHPCSACYDSADYVVIEEKERDELESRRRKDRWL